MSPEHANVLIAEDDPLLLKVMMEALVEAEHKVAAVGATLTEAEAMISQIPALAKQYGEDKIVFILGGSLGGYRPPYDSTNDSQVLLRRMQEAGLGHIKTVGYSGNEVRGVTVDVGKRRPSEELAKAVTAL